MPIFDAELWNSLRAHLALLKANMRTRMLGYGLKAGGLDVLVADFGVVTTHHLDGTVSQKVVGLQCDHASMALMARTWERIR